MTALNLTNWILGTFLGIMTLLFVFRLILSWYPPKDINPLLFNLIVGPTELFLIPLRKLVPPIGGVDITPIIWAGIFSLVREFLLGQQGLLIMLSRLN